MCDVIYASVLQKIISKNQSKCEINFTYYIKSKRGKSSIEALHYCKMILKSIKRFLNDFNFWIFK